MIKFMLLALSSLCIHAFAAETPVIPAAKPAEVTPGTPDAENPKADAKAEPKTETAAAPAAPAETTKTEEAPPPETPKKGIYEGMFTFDWKRLTKCQIVGPVTNAMLANPKNVCKKADKETGGPASCKISDKSEYLIFKTLADCKIEYDEQVKASP